jgi:hypothetical protein
MVSDRRRQIQCRSLLGDNVSVSGTLGIFLARIGTLLRCPDKVLRSPLLAFANSNESFDLTLVQCR